ncbi:MAG: protein DpdE [Verrucomicrobiota bacterium]
MIPPNGEYFVKSSGNDLGLGKALHEGETTSVVQYFDSPTNPTWPQFEIPTDQLKRVTLPDQTRAYYFDPVLGGWRMGRVFDHIDNDIHIQLPNKERAKVSESEVYVRWNKPLNDPWKHIVARLSETPYFHQWRSGLVQHFVRQRSASSGMTGLISAPVELHQHQIEVVHRVLTDSVQRYLLADEVGLGKTIEAGIILRQHILDRPVRHRVLVIAPESLVSQWEAQLRDRCQIGKKFGHHIEIITLGDIEGWDGFQPDFIIVDEAHQLTRMGDGAFSTVRRLSDPTRCRNLLLLSATPVLRNERGFLALLHLLDPTVYDLSDVDGFRERIAKRQNLADLFASFTEDQLPFFLQASAEELAAVFPDDRRLGTLVAELKPLLESENDENGIRALVRRIRVHLSETYRLNRRILRNRRDALLPGLMTGRSKLVSAPWNSSHWTRIHSALEDWRTGAAATVWGFENSPMTESLARIFTLFWEAAESDLEALIFCANLRLRGGDTKEGGEFGPLADAQAVGNLLGVPRFEGEEELLGNIIALKRICGEHRKEQIKMVRQVINLLFGENRRVVCITTSPNSANELFSSLSENSDLVIRHDTVSNNWRSLWEIPGPRVLVCDWRAEEGLNLQGGDCWLIHLDLPFSPNRIEQRMGRLDRFGIGKEVTSLALKPEGAATHNAWALCLNEAWQVFSRSIAALQYVVEGEMDGLTRAFFLEGEDALNSCRERLSSPEGLEREFKLIRNQDALDSIQFSAADESERLKERIEEYENADDELAGKLDDWMSNCLKFIKVGEDDPRDAVIRYHYAKSAKGTNTLLSYSDLQLWFGAAIDRNAHHAHFRPPLTYSVSLRREAAVRRNCGLARVGNPVIDSILAHIAWDDRGASFAMWRQAGDLDMPTPRMFFRLDFIIEADVADEGYSPVLNRLADAAFPPIIETIWIDQDLQSADEECLFELARPYRKPYDTNLTANRWTEAIARTGCGQWTDLCDSVRSAGERLLVEKYDLQSLAKSKADTLTTARALAKEQLISRMEAIPEKLASERAALEQEIQLARSLTRTLVSGILYPLIRLDSVGVVILSGQPLEPSK